jgi:outer membrane protein assembly factor BamB
MVSVFLGTVIMARAQSSDSNGDPNTWSMFHNNLGHTGYSTSTAPTTEKNLWNYTTGGSIEFTSPAIENGVVYIGSDDGNVYALNAATGALEWNQTFNNNGLGLSSSPAVANGIVYVGSGDSNLYAFNTATGALEWNYTTGADVESSPAVANGVVYVGADDYNVYALDAATGKLEWSYLTGGEVKSSPAIANGVVYIGSWDHSLYAFGTPTSGVPEFPSFITVAIVLIIATAAILLYKRTFLESDLKKE